MLPKLLAWFKTRHARVALFYCYAYFLLGVIVASIGPVLPELSRRTNVTLNEGGIGVITTSRSLGYLVGSMGSGVLVEKRPSWGNSVISGSLLCAGTGMVAMTLTNRCAILAMRSGDVVADCCFCVTVFYSCVSFWRSPDSRWVRWMWRRMC